MQPYKPTLYPGSVDTSTSATYSGSMYNAVDTRMSSDLWFSVKNAAKSSNVAMGTDMSSRTYTPTMTSGSATLTNKIPGLGLSGFYPRADTPTVAESSTLTGTTLTQHNGRGMIGRWHNGREFMGAVDDGDCDSISSEESDSEVEISGNTRRSNEMSSEPATAVALNLSGISLSDKLRIAASKGQVDKVQELIAANAGVESDHDGRTALHYAALNGYPAVCKLLIAAGCHTDTQDSLGYTALHRAAAQGHLDVIQVLLLNGCAIDKQDQVHGNASLHEAAWNGYSKSLELLVKSSCDVFITNRAGFTALHLAGQNGHNESSRVLLYAGIDPDMKNNYGDTALHTAARYGHAGVTRILISARCKLNEQNKNGDTALHIAAALRRRKIAKLFMEAGVDITVKNKQGETSVAVAKRKEHPEVILIITGHNKHAKSRHHQKHKLDLISQLEGPEIIPDSQMPLKEPVSVQQPLADSKKDKDKRLFFFRKKKTKEKEKALPTVPPDQTHHPPTHKPNVVHEAGNTHTHGGRVQGRRADMKKGFFSQYVAKTGNQYYRDLAGNIKQGPIGYTPVCQCAPLIHKLEQRVEADRDNLYDHVDASHQVLKEQIDQLDRRTTQQVYALDKLTRERMDAERHASEDRINHRLQQERADTERRLNIFGSTVHCNVQAWVESRFGNLDETIPHPVSHDDSGLYSHKMFKDIHIGETGGRLYRTRSDETLSQSDCSFRHKNKRFYESRQLAMQQIRAWQLPSYNQESRGHNKFDHSTPMPNGSKPPLPGYSKINTQVRFHDRYADGASPSHEASPERAHHPSLYRPVGVRQDGAQHQSSPYRPFDLASPSSSSSHPISSSSQHTPSLHSHGVTSSSHSSVQSQGAIPKRQSGSVGDGQSYTRLAPSPVTRLAPSPITRLDPAQVTHTSTSHSSSPVCKPPPVPAKPPHHSTYISSATAMWNNSILRQPQQSNLNGRGPTGSHGPDLSLIAPVSGPYNMIDSSHREYKKQETDVNDNNKAVQQSSRYQESTSVVHNDYKAQTSLYSAPDISTNTTESKPSDIFRRIPYPYQQKVVSTAYGVDRSRTPDKVSNPIGRGQSPVMTPERNSRSVSPGGHVFNALSPSAQHYPFTAGYSSATRGQLIGSENQNSANVYPAQNISHSPLSLKNNLAISSAIHPEVNSNLDPVYRSAGSTQQVFSTLPTGQPAVCTWSSVQPIGKVIMSCSEPSLLKGKGSNNSNLIRPNTKPPVAAPTGSLSYANRGLSARQQDGNNNYENPPVLRHSKDDSGSNRSNPDSGFWDRGYVSSLTNSRSVCTRTPTSDLSTGTQSSSFSTDYNLSSTQSSIPCMQSSTPIMPSTPPVSETNGHDGTVSKPTVCTPNGPAKFTSHIQSWYQKQSQENAPSINGIACEAVSGKTIGSVEIHQFNNNQHERNIPVRTISDQRSPEGNVPIKTTIDPFTLMRSSDV